MPIEQTRLKVLTLLRIPTTIRIASLTILLLVVVVLFVFRIVLPPLGAFVITGILEDSGLQVVQFPVDRIGVNAASVDPGGIRWQGQELRWNGLKLEYTPWGLLSARADRLEVTQPEASVDFETLLQAPATPADIVVPEEVSLPFPGEEILPEPGTHLGNAAREEMPGEAISPPAPADIPPIRQSGRDPLLDIPSWTALSVFDLVREIPLSELRIDDGSITVGLANENTLSGAWSGSFLLGEDVLTGELFAEGRGFEVSTSFSGMESVNFLSARTTVRMQSEPIENLVRESLIPLAGPDFQLDFHSRGAAELELLLESLSSGELGLSGQATMGKIDLALGKADSEVNIESLHLAGSLRNGELLLSAGIRLEPSILGGIRLGPFGMAAKLDPSGLLTVDSEEIRLAASGWSVRSAFRGRAVLERPGLFNAGRMEWTFDDIDGPEFGIEPFSLLVEAEGRTLHGRVSPVGLRREGTLWIEETQLNWNLDTASGKGQFLWYDASGALAGSVLLDASVPGPLADVSEIKIQLADQKGEVVSNIHYTEGERIRLDAAGRIPVGWLNALTRWWGELLPGSISGKDPVVRLNLSGKPPFFRGEIELEIKGSGFDSDGGTVLEGIRMKPLFTVQVLPRTLERQELQIDSVRMGKFSLNNIHAEWELPILHRLVVHGIEGDLEEGTIHTGAFSFNPLNPDIRTELTLVNLPAGQVMEWLNETRFKLEGSLSGTLEVGWMEGALLLGNGRFRMNDTDQDARFRILDEAFIEDYLLSLESAPADLQDRFREALMEEGVRLHELDVMLQTPGEEGQVVLTVRLSGESKTDRLVIPIEGLVIKNLIPEEDLGRLLGMLGSIRVMPKQ